MLNTTDRENKMALRMHLAWGSQRYAQIRTIPTLCHRPTKESLSALAGQRVLNSATSRCSLPHPNRKHKAYHYIWSRISNSAYSEPLSWSFQRRLGKNCPNWTIWHSVI